MKKVVQFLESTNRWLPCCSTFFLGGGNWIVALIFFVASLFISLMNTILFYQPDSSLFAAVATLFNSLKFDSSTDRMTVYSCLNGKDIVKQHCPYYPSKLWANQRKIMISKGIVGLCARSGNSYIELMPLEVDFLNKMIEKWGFTRFEAHCLLSDRRSYLCIPITNKNTCEVVGIVYCDSSRENAFSSDLVNELEHATETWYNMVGR